jgi:hypothetical protein
MSQRDSQPSGDHPRRLIRRESDARSTEDEMRTSLTVPLCWIMAVAGADLALAQAMRPRTSQLPVARLRTAVCLVAEAAVVGDRVHVRCNYTDKEGLGLNKSNDHPLYFALPVNSPRAAPMLTIFESAGRANRPLYTFWTDKDHHPYDLRNRPGRAEAIQIQYDANDLSGAAFGCENQDCRIPLCVWSPGGVEKGD